MSCLWFWRVLPLFNCLLWHVYIRHNGDCSQCKCYKRTEQLRKLGKLQSYYLDQFNQRESSYATSNRCETALQLELQRLGLSFQGLCAWELFRSPWWVWAFAWYFLHEIKLCPVSMWVQCCVDVAWMLLLHKGMTQLELSGLPGSSTPGVRQRLMLAHQNCTPARIDSPLPNPLDLMIADVWFPSGGHPYGTRWACL